MSSQQQFASSVAHIPRSGARWVVDRRPSPAQVRDEGPLDLVLWLDAKDGSVLAHDLLSRSAPSTAVWESFRRAMLEPMQGLPSRPRRLQVGSASLHDAVKELAPLLHLDLELRERQPLIDAAFELFEEALQTSGFSYLDREGVSPRMVGDLAELTVDWYAREPWNHTANDELVELSGLLPAPLYCTILGQNQTEFGIGVFFTPEGVHACFHGKDIRRHAGMGILFQDPEEMGSDTVLDIEEHGWELNEKGQLVCLMRHDRPDDPGPTVEELALARRIVTVMLELTPGLEKGKPFTFGATIDGFEVSGRWPVDPDDLPKRRSRRRKSGEG